LSSLALKMFLAQKGVGDVNYVVWLALSWVKIKIIEMLQPDNLDRLLGRSLFFFLFFCPGSVDRPAAKFFLLNLLLFR